MTSLIPASIPDKLPAAVSVMPDPVRKVAGDYTPKARARHLSKLTGANADGPPKTLL